MFIDIDAKQVTSYALSALRLHYSITLTSRDHAGPHHVFFPIWSWVEVLTGKQTRFGTHAAAAVVRCYMEGANRERIATESQDTHSSYLIQ